ncbi:MAG: hypothetical protein R2781_00200 [Flavobacteriaceae bacterium]
MKHFKSIVAIASLLFVVASCTPESQNENEYQIDKDKNCPPNDRNCNGIPDNQE